MDQNYSNHRKWVPWFHFILTPILLGTFIGAGINLYNSMGSSGLYSAALIFVLTFGVIVLFLLSRTFSIRAQDRVIRAEENFRHYLMTQKTLDSKLTMRQIIGIRFASDEEFLDLAKKAVDENMSEEDIKKAIKNWKADTYRV